MSKKIRIFANYFSESLNMVHKLYGYIAVFFSMILWGISFVWTKELLEAHFPVIMIVTFRLIIAASLMLLVFSLTHSLEKVKKKDISTFFLLAFFEPFLYFIGENFSMQFVEASFAAIVIGVIPVVVPFALFIFNKEKVHWEIIFGVVLSIVGIAFMSLGKGFSFNVDIRGVLLLVLAVLAAVGYSVVLSRLLGSYGPITITTYQTLIAILYYLPLFFIFDFSSLATLNWSFKAVSDIVLLAVLCSSGAFILYNYAGKKLGVAKSSVFTNAIPLVTIVFAILVGQETLCANKVIGMAIVIGGVMFSQFGLKTRQRFKQNTKAK